MHCDDSFLQAPHFGCVLCDRVCVVLVSMDYRVNARPHQRAESIWPIRCCHYYDGGRIRPLGVAEIFRPTRPVARRGKAICDRFPDANTGLLDRGWHYALCRIAGLRFFDRKIARSAGTFSLHFPVHRTRRGTRLAWFRSAAVTGKIFSLGRESHSSSGLGALASPARGKRIPIVNCAGVSSVAVRRHFYADMAFQSYEWQRLSADALSRHG